MPTLRNTRPGGGQSCQTRATRQSSAGASAVKRHHSPSQLPSKILPKKSKESSASDKKTSPKKSSTSTSPKRDKNGRSAGTKSTHIAGDSSQPKQEKCETGRNTRSLGKPGNTNLKEENKNSTKLVDSQVNSCKPTKDGLERRHSRRHTSHNLSENEKEKAVHVPSHAAAEPPEDASHTANSPSQAASGTSQSVSERKTGWASMQKEAECTDTPSKDKKESHRSAQSDDVSVHELSSNEEEEYDSNDVMEVSDSDSEIQIPHSTGVTSAEEQTELLKQKVLDLEMVLHTFRVNTRKHLEKKEEELQRMRNELKWKSEQLVEMNSLMEKNMELEAKLHLLLHDKEAYEKEVQKTMKKESPKKQDDKQSERQQDTQDDKRKSTRQSQKQKKKKEASDVDSENVPRRKKSKKKKVPTATLR